MSATEFLDSNALVNLDSQPIIVPTSGEGAPGYVKMATDQVAPTIAGGIAGGTYRLARFPVDAKVKRVWLYTKGVDSSGTASATLDINVAFSDSQFDGTSASLQSTIPTTANTGAVTTVATYTNPNKLFGAAVPLLSLGAAQFIDVTYKGAYLPENNLVPLWDYFGFNSSTNLPAATPSSPGGFFDILLYVAHGAAVTASGDIGVEVDFVL